MEGSVNAFQQLPMRWHQKFSFGLGHIFNDLCSAMWFSLLLLYFQYILHFPDNMAGYLLLIGQCVDAFCTPPIGLLSDRFNGIRCIGKRKTWHVFGSLAVLVSFPFIFIKCLNCSTADIWVQFAYYAVFIAVFQVGWASVQISHMSLISQLTDNPSEKTELSGIRNAGTLMSSIIVFGMSWGFFGPDKGSSWDDADATKFMILMLVVIGLGFVCTLIFNIVLKEKSVDAAEHERHLVTNEELPENFKMAWYEWFKEPQFWLVAGMYMCSRLVINVSGTYWPLYVLYALKMHKMYVGVIPLVVNVTGFFVSLLMRRLSDRIGRKMTMMIGAVITIGGCVWLYFIHSTPLQVIGPSILIGGGGSVLIVTSLAMTTDIIGPHKNSGAFVFGAMSFTDKLSNGLAIALIQQFFPNCPIMVMHCDGDVSYYHMIMVYIVGGFAVGVFVILVITWPQQLGHLRKFARLQNNGHTAIINGPASANNSFDDDDSIEAEVRALFNGTRLDSPPPSYNTVFARSVSCINSSRTSAPPNYQTISQSA